MMNQADNLVTLDRSLKQLYLSTFRVCYQGEADLARQESLSCESYLHGLVIRECEERRHNRITRYSRESRLPLEKSLATFEKTHLPAKPSGLVYNLLEGTCRMMSLQ